MEYFDIYGENTYQRQLDKLVSNNIKIVKKLI